MICSCLPSIRGLFPAFKFKKGTTSSTPKNKTNASARSEITSGHRPNSVYIKMSDVAASRADSDEERLVSEPTYDKRGITVTTDINVTRL